MTKHILVPVDLAATDASAKAMEEAKSIARKEGAAVTVVSVISAWPDYLEKRAKEFENDLASYIETIGDGLNIKPVVKIGGSVSGRIIETCREVGADMIVMASHDPRISDYMIGSNAGHVALHADCSVLIVR